MAGGYPDSLCQRVGPVVSAPGCPGLAACVARNPRCGHADRVFTYRDARTAWELRQESDNPGMYASELRDWGVSNPGLTFRDYLTMTRDTRR